MRCAGSGVHCKAGGQARVCEKKLLSANKRQYRRGGALAGQRHQGMCVHV